MPVSTTHSVIGPWVSIGCERERERESYSLESEGSSVLDCRICNAGCDGIRHGEAADTLRLLLHHILEPLLAKYSELSIHTHSLSVSSWSIP